MEISLGVWMALLTTLCWSIGIFPFAEASKRLGANTANAFRLLLAAIILTFLSAFLVKSSFRELFAVLLMPSHHRATLLFILSGIIGLSVGDYFCFRSLASLGARLSSLFSTLAPGAALLTSSFFLTERINFIGIIGIVISISGVMWLSLSKKDRKKRKVVISSANLKSGIIFGVLSALCQGFSVVLSKMGMNDIAGIHPLHVTWIRLVASAGIIYIPMIAGGQFRHLKKMSQPILKNQQGGVPFLLVGVIFGPVAGVTLSLYAVQMIEVSVAQTIFSLIPVFALFNAWVLYREKITGRSLLASLIAIFGVVLLIWRDHIL